MRLDELFDTKGVVWEDKTHATFEVGGEQFKAAFVRDAGGGNHYDFAFYAVKGLEASTDTQWAAKYGNTGDVGKSGIKVFSYALSALEQFISTNRPYSLAFSGDPKTKRDELYTRMATALESKIKNLGYTLTTKRGVMSGNLHFTLKRDNRITEDVKTVSESVTMQPGVKTIKADGGVHIEYPPNSMRRVMKSCQWCDGTGKDIQSDAHEEQFGRPLACDACEGKGQSLSWECDFPEMRLTYMNTHFLSEITGKGDNDTGWISPEMIPVIKRKLIRLMNGGADDLTRASSEKQDVVVDKSGPIAKIGRGPTMYDGGVSKEQLDHMISKMMEILDWAQKNKTGVYWA